MLTRTSLFVLAMFGGDQRTVDTLHHVLVRDIGAGGTVAILPSYEGLVAVSPDGKRRKVLHAFKPMVTNVNVDNRGEVIWFERGDPNFDLLALDLAAPPAEPTLIVSGLSFMSDVTVVYDNPRESLGPDNGRTFLFLDAQSGIHFEHRVCQRKRRDVCDKWAQVPCQPTDPKSECPDLPSAAREFLAKVARRSAGGSIYSPPIAKTRLPRVKPQAR